MGQTIKLTDPQWDQLDHLRMSTASADVFRNCTIILMSAVGRSKTSISKDLGCCTDTVARVRRLYRKRRIVILGKIDHALVRSTNPSWNLLAGFCWHFWLGLGDEGPLWIPHDHFIKGCGISITLRGSITKLPTGCFSGAHRASAASRG